MKRNKIQPAVQTLTFTTAPVPQGATGRFYIDMSQICSIVNRRFYRQGLNMAVSGIKVSASGPGAVFVGKLPNTWVTSNAWEKAFRMWNKQQMEAVAEAGSESTVAKFRDFKVFMDTKHVDQYMAAGQNLNATNLLPLDFEGNTSLTGEWQPSQIVLPNLLPDASGTDIEPAEFLLHMVGTNDHISISKGVIEGYADSRAYPQSPDPVGPNPASANNWMRAMFDTGNDNHEILQNTLRNDELPYDQDDYPGGQNNFSGLQIHDYASIFESNLINGLSTQRLKGGNFPCGLIAIDWSPALGDGQPTPALAIQVDLIPGNHRGYLCEPMTEM